MPSLLSLHWIPVHRSGDDKGRFAAWAPPFAKIVTSDERVPYLEDVPASVRIVCRSHPLSENYDNRGIANRLAAIDMARAHAAACNRMAAYCESQGVPRSRLLFEGLNEPNLWSIEPPALTAAYYAEFLVCLHDYRLYGVALNCGVGWPGNAGPEQPPQWAELEPIRAAMLPGDYLGLHEYWDIGGPQQGWRWLAGRYTQCPWQVPILITECGIDRGVVGQTGGWWELPGSSTSDKAHAYIEQLAWYEAQLRQDRRIAGACVFTYDIGSAAWERFDIRTADFLNPFLAYVQSQPPVVPPVQPPPPPPVVPPPPPPVGDMAAALTAAESQAVAQVHEMFADLQAVAANGQQPGPGRFALRRPLAAGVGSVSQWFGENPENYSEYGLAGHEGLDYAVPVGTPVYAAQAGQVSGAHNEGNYGLHVLIDDVTTGLTTVYAHLSDATVQVGETVQAGTLVGHSGSSGRSTGPHLHFGMRIDGVANPAYGNWLDPVLGRKIQGDA